MAVNKVVFGAVSIMDISDSTVTPDTLAQGVTAYDKAGEKITGTMQATSDPVLQSKTVSPTTSKQTVTPDSGYDGLSSVTVNAMTTATQATPSITVSTSGLITAKSTQSAGYVSAGTKSATKQLTTQAAKTVTPTTSNQTAVASGRYTTGAVTVKGDSNLVASNIKKGTSIFGVTGTYEGSGGGSSSGGSVETCTVTMNLPTGVCVFGYGEFQVLYSGTSLGTYSMPSTKVNAHMIAVDTTRVFNNLPLGSTFTFYFGSGIQGASVSNNIEFSFANHLGINSSTYLFAMCKCNGDGEITITT
jgi:hypothetical protein